MKRSKHSLSHYRLFTGNMGTLMPISAVPVLPGDTFQGNTTALIRLSPLNTPVMHPTHARIHHFFVPNRIVWDGWEDFITGGDGTPQPDIPTVVADPQPNRLLGYMGVPPLPGGAEVNALPLRACNKIINEYYIDQDLVAPRAEDDSSAFRIAWEKDYFSTARPWSQKGPSVTLPLGDRAPVSLDGVLGQEMTVQASDGNRYLYNDGGAGNIQLDQINNSEEQLYADLASATAPSINDFRAAFAIQRYQEARARYGSRFTEYLRYLGVTPSDARLQRPEFLGGGTTRLQFSEVLQTTPDAETGLGVGDLYGHGIAGMKSNRYRKFFEEHGYVITMFSVRPKSIYMNGLQRDWIKRTKEDYFQKELTNLGQQEVFKQELYSDAAEGEVFGFQDRYNEYRSHPSQVTNDFRDTLNSWHMARELDDTVTLNEEFVECDPTKRIFQIEDQSVHSIWVMANNHIVARRMVPARANPRII